MIKKIFAGLFFLTILANIALANSSVSKGREMEKLSAQRDSLRSELLGLDNKLAEAASISMIKGKARNLGMGPGRLQILPPAPVALVAP